MTHAQTPVASAAVSRCYSSLGLRFRLHCRDADLSLRFAELYAACATEPYPAEPRNLTLDIRVDAAHTGAPPDSERFELRADNEVCCRNTDRNEILEWCAWRINQSAIEQHSPPALLLHSAAAARAGSAVLLAGPSGSGKSTLVTALTLAGLAYMGDDAVAVEAEGTRVRSNPKPIALDDTARAALLRIAPAHTELLRARAIAAPTGIGAVAPTGATFAPAIVVRPQYHPSAAVTLAALSPADIAELLVDQSFNFATNAPAGLHTAAEVARTTRGYSLVFGDLAGAVETLLGLLP